MDPFTIALATFGIQKLRGKSTRTALKDAALMGGGSYAVGALTPNIPQLSALRQPAFSSLGFNTGTTTSGNFLSNVVGKKPNFYILEYTETIDIDTPLDFEFAEHLYKKIKL